jgi:hypothetical protein
MDRLEEVERLDDAAASLKGIVALLYDINEARHSGEHIYDVFKFALLGEIIEESIEEVERVSGSLYKRLHGG